MTQQPESHLEPHGCGLSDGSLYDARERLEILLYVELARREELARTLARSLEVGHSSLVSTAVYRAQQKAAEAVLASSAIIVDIRERIAEVQLAISGIGR